MARKRRQYKQYYFNEKMKIPTSTKYYYKNKLKKSKPVDRQVDIELDNAVRSIQNQDEIDNVVFVDPLIETEEKSHKKSKVC